jgi:hypothetical protein
MTIDNNIQLLKEIPGTQRYIPIDGMLVRNGDYLYFKVGIDEIVVRITRNNDDIAIVRRDDMYQLYIEDCSDNYKVYIENIPHLIIEVSVDSLALENPIFQINNQS